MPPFAIVPAVRNCDRCDEYPQRRRCRKTADDVGNDLLRGKRINVKAARLGWITIARSMPRKP
jgi:hypothetical protein